MLEILGMFVKILHEVYANEPHPGAGLVGASACLRPGVGVL